MTQRAQELLRDALALPSEERADIASELIASLDGPADDPAEVEAAWAVEIERRARRVLDGELAGGLGSEFLGSVDVARDLIARWPHAAAPLLGVSRDLPVRRAPVHGFPYDIVYLETPFTIRVLAFAHDRRRPRYWHSRLLHPSAPQPGPLYYYPSRSSHGAQIWPRGRLQ